MRLFFADLLMTVGAIVVLFGWVGAGGYAISVIAVGLGMGLLGYLLDWRSRLRAVVRSVSASAGSRCTERWRSS